MSFGVLRQVIVHGVMSEVICFVQVLCASWMSLVLYRCVVVGPHLCCYKCVLLCQSGERLVWQMLVLCECMMV